MRLLLTVSEWFFVIVKKPPESIVILFITGPKPPGFGGDDISPDVTKIFS